MFTKRQIWRRTKTNKDPPNNFEESNEQGDSLSELPSKIEPKSENSKLRSALSMNNLSKLGTDTRNLRFSSTVQVLLIQERNEMEGLTPLLFWNVHDYQQFKEQAIQEIRDAAKQYKIPSKKAMQLLYQPPLDDSPNSTPNISREISFADFLNEEGESRFRSNSMTSSAGTPPENLKFFSNVKAEAVKPTSAEQKQIWAVQWKKDGDSK